jgi:invasion protein IalB
MRHSFAVLVAAVASLSSSDHVMAQQDIRGTADEFAARGQRDARTVKYGNWEKFCFKPGGARMVCRTTIAGRFETGQIAVRAYIVEREGDNVTRIQLLLPVGLYVPAGVKLTVDGGTPYTVPFTWCLTNTCIAGYPAEPELLHEMERGRSLAIEVVDTNMLAVKTSAPLDQFVEVYRGVPVKTFEQTIDE